MPAVALTIAGSDPSGGAGIQADLKTFHQFGVYGEAVITLITVQNTLGVSQVEVLRPTLVRQQVEAVLSDIPPAAAKIGALGNADVIEAIAGFVNSFACPVILDPIMVSQHGGTLLSVDAVQALKHKLFPHVYLVTPNIPETEALTGTEIESESDMLTAAQRLIDFGCRAVLIKGGHADGDPNDLLVVGGQTSIFRGNRIDTPHTHGTGCTYSAAITACIAQGMDLTEAVRVAKLYIQSAIESAPGLGLGKGPVNHFAETTD